MKNHVEIDPDDTLEERAGMLILRDSDGQLKALRFTDRVREDFARMASRKHNPKY